MSKRSRKAKQKRFYQHTYPSFLTAARSVISKVKENRVRRLDDVDHSLRKQIEELTEEIIRFCEVSKDQKRVLRQTVQSSIYDKFDHRLRSVSGHENLEMKNLDDVLNQEKVVKALPRVIQSLIRHHNSVHELKLCAKECRKLTHEILRAFGPRFDKSVQKKALELAHKTREAQKLYSLLSDELRWKFDQEAPHFLKNLKTSLHFAEAALQ